MRDCTLFSYSCVIDETHWGLFCCETFSPRRSVLVNLEVWPQWGRREGTSENPRVTTPALVQVTMEPGERWRKIPLCRRRSACAAIVADKRLLGAIHIYVQTPRLLLMYNRDWRLTNPLALVQDLDAVFERPSGVRLLPFGL
jgi:hypothetical protein